MTTSRLFLPLALASCLALAPASRGDDNKVALFDGQSLKGWYVFLKKQAKNEDPDKVFTVEDHCVHASGKRFGYISTEQEYSNYKLTVSFRWGELRWPPRADAVRDAGVIYHAQGEDMVWSNGVEFQIQEGDVGDLWLVPGKELNPVVTIRNETFGGTNRCDRVPKWTTHEMPRGEWNSLVLIVKGKHFEHWVNGECVLSGDMKERDKGRILLQSEGAEVWYRDISLEKLP